MKMPKFEYDTVRFLKILLFLFGGFIVLVVISWFFPYSIQGVLNFDFEFCNISQVAIHWGFPSYFLSGGWICFPMLVVAFYLIFRSKIDARLELNPKLSGGILLGTIGSIISLIVLSIYTILIVPYFLMMAGTGYYLFMISVIGIISTILIMIFTLLFEKEKLNSLRDLKTTEE